jgi:inorganic phosphate transporter, PiT family
VLVVVIALAFDYVNGFHDAANAIATVVSTRALQPRHALIMAGCLNFLGAFASTNVASTIGKGLVVIPAHQEVILSALLGALFWNLLTWWWGLPSSSSHALVGGLIGAVSYHVGSVENAVQWRNLLNKVILPGLISPLLAILAGYCLMAFLLWVIHLTQPTPSSVNRRFRTMQKFSACLTAFMHGMADAQKVMGVITMALITEKLLPVPVEGQPFFVPIWVKASCALMIALGTSAGGWKIIKTMGSKIFKLEPIHGFAADLTSSALMHTTAHFGMPLSTTHVITGSIMGVGASKRVSAVRWGVAKRILAAWVFTIPASAAVSALTCAVVEYMAGTPSGG